MQNKVLLATGGIILLVVIIVFIAALILMNQPATTPATTIPNTTNTNTTTPVSSTTTTTTPTNSQTNTTSQNISIVDMSYSPSTVTIAQGTKVTWTNNDSVSHTVTSDTGDFDSGTLTPGGTFDFTFNTVGTYAYHCKIHGLTMSGVVIVQ